MWFPRPHGDQQLFFQLFKQIIVDFFTGNRLINPEPRFSLVFNRLRFGARRNLLWSVFPAPERFLPPLLFFCRRNHHYRLFCRFGSRACASSSSSVISSLAASSSALRQSLRFPLQPATLLAKPLRVDVFRQRQFFTFDSHWLRRSSTTGSGCATTSASGCAFSLQQPVQ